MRTVVKPIWVGLVVLTLLLLCGVPAGGIPSVDADGVGSMPAQSDAAVVHPAGDTHLITSDAETGSDDDNDTGTEPEGELRVPRNESENIYVGETVTIGFPEGHGGETYNWTVLNGDDNQLLHTSTEELNAQSGDKFIPHDARVTSFRPETSGSYEIQVIVDNQEEYATTIEVQEEQSYLDGMSRHDLIREFAPILNLHPDESFYPTRYEAYIENAELKKGTIPSTVVSDATLLDMALKTEGDSESLYINPKTSELPDVPIIGKPSHEEYQAVVEDVYPANIYGSIHEDVSFDETETSYTAIGYWIHYIHDPKPEGEELARHTGDQEPFFVLVDESGDPQWIGVQQHFGGELRRWERVQTTDGRPILYPSQGAHPNFLDPRTELEQSIPSPEQGTDIEQLYQQQYLCMGGGGPLPCGADGSGKPKPVQTLTGTVTAATYVDPVANPMSAPGERWAPDGASGIGADTTYDVTLLSGNESWSAYQGDLYRYIAGSIKTRGAIPQQQFRWGGGGLESYLDPENPSDNFEVFPAKDQINGSVCGPDYIPEECIQDVEYTLSGTPTELVIPLANTGFQPHEFTVTVMSDNQETDVNTTEKYSIFIGTGSVSVLSGLENTVDPNYGGTEEAALGSAAEVPLNVTGTGPWNITVKMSIYPDNLGGGYLESKHTLSSVTFPEVSSVGPADLNISTVDGEAGTINVTRPVSAIIELERNGDPLSDEAAPDTYNITVGDNSVDPADIIVDSTGSPGEYEVIFTPPTQPEPGDYDLEITAEGVLDNRSDAITYGEGAITQVASALMIDRSGSMNDVMDEAKEGASTYVEQATDEDYVSIISYSTSSSIDQGLTRMGDGRSDVLNAIDGISAGGGTFPDPALNDGLDILSEAPDGTIRAGVLMADGESDESKNNIIENIVPAYNEAGVCLYTIGFTDGSDEAFMQEIADLADCGSYEFAGASGEVGSIQETLQAVFQEIAGDVAGLETILDENGMLNASDSTSSSFGVDDSVAQMTANLRLENADLTAGANGSAVVRTANVTPTTSEEIALLRPNGTEVSNGDPNVNISVIGDSLIYRIGDPVTGQWSYQIENTGSEPAEYVAEVTADAGVSLLNVTSTGTPYYTGGQVRLRASLVGSDGGVDGATVELNLTTPNGTTGVTLTEERPGIYTGTLTPEEAGAYNGTVVAQKDSLTRTGTVSWTVEETPPVSVVQTGSPAVLRDTSTQFTLNVVNEDTGTPSPGEEVPLTVSELTRVDGSGTIPASQVSLSSRSVDPTTESNVTTTVLTSEQTPTGEYTGTVRVFPPGGGVVTGQVNVTVLAPANLNVTILETNSPVNESEPLEVVTELTNTGDVDDEQQIFFEVLGFNETASVNVSLDGGETAVEEFSTPTEQGDAGTYSGIVSGSDNSDSRPLQVLAPPFFDVAIDEDTSVVNVSAGQKITVNATVVNTGDYPDNQTVALTVGGESSATRTVQLEPGEQRRVALSQQVTAAADGELATVTTANRTRSIQLDVLDPSFFDLSIDDNQTVVNVSEHEDITVNATVTNTGESPGNQTVTLALGGDSVSSETVQLGPGELERVEFTQQVTATADGELATVITGNTTRSVQVSVDFPDPLPGFETRPLDPDMDGLYQDTTGDGTIGVFDVQALFDALGSDVLQAYTEEFKFAGTDRGRVSIFDVQALFVRVST